MSSRRRTTPPGRGKRRTIGRRGKKSRGGMEDMGAGEFNLKLLSEAATQVQSAEVPAAAGGMGGMMSAADKKEENLRLVSSIATQPVKKGIVEQSNDAFSTYNLYIPAGARIGDYVVWTLDNTVTGMPGPLDQDYDKDVLYMRTELV